MKTSSTERNNPFLRIISRRMSLVQKRVKSLSAFAFCPSSLCSTGLLPVRMLQTGNKGFCPGLPGRSVLEVAPLRSLVGAQGGAELSYVLFVTAVPPSQTLYWIFFSFLKLWTRIPTCPLRALSSDDPESINPCVT